MADRRHLSGGTSAGGHALWSQTGRGSATATVLIRSPYSCWLQRREWAPYSPQGTRHLRPLPGTSASLHPPVPGHPHFGNLLSIEDVQAPRPPCGRRACGLQRDRARPRTCESSLGVCTALDQPDGLGIRAWPGWQRGGTPLSGTVFRFWAVGVDDHRADGLPVNGALQLELD